METALWAEIKKVLLARAPAHPETSDSLVKQATDGCVRKGYERAILEIEKLPTERETPTTDHFDRPAMDPRD